MSTEPTTTPEPQPTTDATSASASTTEIAARGRSDPWAAEGDEHLDTEFTAARAPRQFDPYSLARMRNLMDDENAYCN